MKARDIIPGWPRGRSTCGPDSWKWRWIFKMRTEEDLANTRYHDEQQAMVTAYIERPLHEALLGLSLPGKLDRTEIEVIAARLTGQRLFEEYSKNTF